jgi:hypothetical protein
MKVGTAGMHLVTADPGLEVKEMGRAGDAESGRRGEQVSGRWGEQKIV